MRSERGSITLFVLIAMIFFLAIAMSAYVSASNKLRGQNGEIEQIKAGYEQDISEIGLASLYDNLVQKKYKVTYNNNYLPSEYQQVEYIESNGEQWISTNIVPTNTTGVYAKIASTNINDDLIYLGSKGSGDSRFWMGNTGQKFYFGWNAALSNRPTVTEKSINKIEMNYLNSRQLVFNDNIYYSNIENLNTNSNPITIFAGNNGTASYKSNILLYELKITQGTNVSYNFIPCYRKADNVVGLYDTVNNIFYTNSGTGTFSKGMNISGEYQRVEYIESTGTQWISTDIIPTNTTGVYAKIASTDINKDAVYFGSKGSGEARFWVGNNGQRFYFGWNSVTSIENRPVITANSINQIKMNYLNNRALIFNNNTSSSDIGELGSNNNALTIFAGNNGNPSYMSKLLLYEFKVTQGTNLAYSLIPCYRIIDDEIGLYDIINNKFYANSGTGVFSKGEEIINDSTSMKPQNFIYDASQKLSKNTFTNANHRFTGWNTKPDGSGKSYSDEQRVLNLSEIDGDVITLYAQWEKIDN